MDRLETLRAFLDEDPDDPFLRYALASEYLKRGAEADALQTFEALVRDHPTYVGTYYHLGKLYEALQRPDDAQATYRAGMRVATTQGDAHARAELQSALLEAQGFGADD